MSDFKNIYGEHVAWFCYEGAISLEDLRDQKFYISDEFEVCVEYEDGRECRASVDVIKLLESAYVALEEKDKEIKELEDRWDGLWKWRDFMPDSFVEATEDLNPRE